MNYNSKRINTDSIFNIYTILLFGVMPYLVSFWRAEVFYDIKIIFTLIITIPLFVYLSIKKPVKKITRFDILLLIFTFCIIVSTFFSSDVKLSLLGAEKCREGIVSFLLYIMIFYMYSKYYNMSSKTFEIILVLASIMGLYGLLQYYKIIPELKPLYEKTARIHLTTIGNRNFAGTYSTIMLPFSVYYFLRTGYKRYIIYSASVFSLLLCSMTRSAWLAFGIWFPVLVYFSIKSNVSWKRIASIVGVFLVVFVVINFNPPTREVITKRAKTVVDDAKNIKEDKSGSNRIHIWKNIFPLMFERPITGNGPDTFGVIYKKYPYRINADIYKANNEYLHIAVTLGFPALITYLILVSLIMLGILKRVRNYPLMQVLFCCLMGYLIQAFFNISVISTAPMYWALLGTGAYQLQKFSKKI